MYYDVFHRSFSDTDDLETVHESDCIFAFETPEIFRPEGILSQRGKWSCSIVCLSLQISPLWALMCSMIVYSFKNSD